MEQAAVQSSVENAARILHCALHFIEHNAFQHEAAAAVALEPVALLQEVVPVQPGKEHGVQVDLGGH